ncbi:uncharacterized oxidoreductase YjmC-like isoform X1 [Xenia sp. Carnegie-2017]|uniref:uncharacterized oxidoreductase YjmC-like isoform X1 n=2 Tax=Xenia sp. Carnegie-2017 TaxID=2897299 RepID=UPI001F035B08|nr:uncharacterized oxidoreductase YjmC-like isoform X1 [Xenia sp. Carnegie-2017]
MSSKASFKLVSVEEVSRFIQSCMCRVGTDPGHSKILADVLVAADARGHFSHGLNRLAMYVHDVQEGTTSSIGHPVIEKETVSTALIDAKNILGPVSSTFCMDLAIKKAKETGVGWLTCHNANHFGIAGYYSMKAAQHGLIGMAMTNTSPLMVPTRAKVKTLGTNPLSVAAAGKCEGSKNEKDMFVLDMATTSAALGKVEMAHRKHEKIPDGWAVDSDGNQTNDAAKALNGGLNPLGGSEVNSGYKGYGLCFMVELFCGILSGGAFGPHIRRWGQNDVPANLGQCFVAVDPNKFAPGFEERLSSLMNDCRSLEPVDKELEVMVAGDPERKHISKVEKNGGIHYHVNLLSSLDSLADELQVQRMHQMEV